jgi:hypothetical protein
MIKHIRNLMIFAVVFGFTASLGLFAQEAKTGETKKDTDPRKEYSEAERPEENYLARFKAIEVSERLIRENLEDIYMLKIVSSNFKDQGWEGDYKQIYEQYKKGVGYFYKRDVIYARVELERNKKAIYDLYKKIAEYYKTQTTDMLNKCADAILDLSLDDKMSYDVNRNKTVFRNMSRLRIAYGQTDDAQNNYDDGLYPNAIYHYRVAKAYGIQILEQLDPQNSKGKYDVHKADNMNRVLKKEESSSTAK